MESRADKITTADAARILGVTDGRVRQMILKGQLRAEKFGRDLMVSRGEVVLLKGRKPGRPKKETQPAPKRIHPRKPYLKPLDEIIAESGAKPWTDEDFERAAEFADLFVGFDEWLKQTRTQDAKAEAARWARLGL